MDCVIEATTLLDYYSVSDQLRTLGFRVCTQRGAPTCRWEIEHLVVDVMPTRGEALGFNNRFYDLVMVEPIEVQLELDLKVSVVNAPTFLATKFDAFQDRGGGNYPGDADFEDIVTVLAHRSSLMSEIASAEPRILSYLAERSRELIARPDLAELVSGCLDSDRVSQSYVPAVVAMLGVVATLG